MFLQPQEKGLASSYTLSHPLNPLGKVSIIQTFVTRSTHGNHTPECVSFILLKPLTEPCRAGDSQDNEGISHPGGLKNSFPGCEDHRYRQCKQQKGASKRREMCIWFTLLLWWWFDFLSFWQEADLPKDHYILVRATHFWRMLITVFLIFINPLFKTVAHTFERS